MMLAGIFGGVLCVLLVVGDWYQFTSLRPFAAQYGLGVAGRRDRLDHVTRHALLQSFGAHGTMALPHGVARWFDEHAVISLRPSYQLFSMRFRTAWPLKGTVTLHPAADGVELRLTKRMPWSSGLLTITWLALVALGTVAFLIMFGMDGGFLSISGWALGLGVGGVGALVLLFGLTMIALAYRLEDARLMQVYQELRDALTARPSV